MNAANAQSAVDLQVLIVEPDDQIAAEIVSALDAVAPSATGAVTHSLAEARERLLDQKPALFVLDVDASHEQVQEFIYDLRTSHPEARAIILTSTHFNAAREQVAALGAIHFLEKPFPRADFMILVEALLSSSAPEGERFQGTLSDLHIADIIQLKCISGATSALEFTGPRGEKARVHFENGQVRHATAPGKIGLEAFNEIVDWKGGVISEVPVTAETPQTIELGWQVLLMEAVRNLDESREREFPVETTSATAAHKILVIDDSAMLVSFVKDMLEEQGYGVTTAETGADGLTAARTMSPHLILLDFILPDMRGDEVGRQLMADSATSKIPVVYISGLGSDLQSNQSELPNVVGSLSKPFTSDVLITTVNSYLFGGELPVPSKSKTVSAKPKTASAPVTPVAPAPVSAKNHSPSASAAHSPALSAEAESNAYFCGDSSFFSLHWALQTISRERLTGILRAFWSRDSVELLARDGEVVLVTTKNPALYCDEAPVTLLNVDREEVEAARQRQASDGCPLFITLAGKDLILREPGLQLVQHYGQKLFSRLWTERVRFIFDQQPLPEFARELPAADEGIDQWSLSTLRFVQFQELDPKVLAETNSVPAYTRDGFERVQELRLTIAEAQFASQFNGSRSVAQISKNLRLDIKFARLTLFRFLALEIVECWPAQVSAKPESRGGLRGIFGR